MRFRTCRGVDRQGHVILAQPRRRHGGPGGGLWPLSSVGASHGWLARRLNASEGAPASGWTPNSAGVVLEPQSGIPGSLKRGRLPILASGAAEATAENGPVPVGATVALASHRLDLFTHQSSSRSSGHSPATCSPRPGAVAKSRQSRDAAVEFEINMPGRTRICGGGVGTCRSGTPEARIRRSASFSAPPQSWRRWGRPCGSLRPGPTPTPPGRNSRS